MKDQQRYILSIDQGTTSCRAILFDAYGKKQHTAQEEFTQYFPQEGWVEHDALEIWQKQLNVTKRVIQDNQIKADQIIGIGITNQRETTIVWDRETGIPIHRAIVWQDRRTSKMCDELRQSGHGPMVKEKTGLLLDAYFSGTKVKYILDTVPNARKLATEGKLAFGTIDSWLIYNLTGKQVHATDITNASRTMLYNIRECCWDEELLELLDIPLSLLPKVKDCTDHFGNTEHHLLGRSIPIHGVAGDQQSALFGQLCLDAGSGKNTYGTGCFLVINTGDQIVASQNKLLTTIAWRIKGQTQYALEGSVFIGGAVIQWLRDGLKIINSSQESETLANTVKDSGGIIFVPALTGLGAPHWDQYARGALLGITRATKSAHIARAAIESIALQVHDLVRAMEADLGRNLDVLKVDGGAINNELLMQLQADLLKSNIIKPQELETTALGAAYLAGLGVGHWSSTDDLKALWQVEKTYSPSKDINYTEKLVANWQKGIQRSKNWIDS